MRLHKRLANEKIYIHINYKFLFKKFLKNVIYVNVNIKNLRKKQKQKYIHNSKHQYKRKKT